MLGIRVIDESNFDDVLKLKVAKNQSKYVATVEKSLAQCWLYRDEGDVFPFAITKNNIPVGFVMFEMNEEYRQFIVWRIFIDENHQGKGYGTETLKLITAMAASDENYDELILDYVIGNDTMKSVVEKVGFEYSRNRDEYGEIEMKINLKKLREKRD